MNDSPLDITVHKLPSVDVTALQAGRTGRGRWKMLALLFICALPVIASYLMYYVIRPNYAQWLAVKSFGQLVQPQRPMPDAAGLTLEGAPTTLASLRGQWLLASISGGACQQPCPDQLYMQRQLRETLGKEKDRLDWVWFISDGAPLSPELSARLMNPQMRHQGFQALRMKESHIAAWLNAGSARLYLIDPQGNYMMHFPENMATEQAAKAKADINRLLRASSFWDMPGREKVEK